MSAVRPVGQRGRHILSRHLFTRFASSATVPLSDPLPLAPTPEPYNRQSPEQAKISRLTSGVAVASLETFSPVSRIAVIVDAGSRFETEKNFGVTHYLRNCAFLSTSNYTAFRVSREIEQLGGHLSSTVTRDHFMYTADCMRDDIGIVMEALASVALSPAFHPWEVNAQTARVELDLKMAAESPTIGIMENLHKGAFRATLGNSLYCPSYNLGKITPDHLHAFVSSHFDPNRMAIVGIGVNSEDFLKSAQGVFGSVKPPEQVTTKQAAQYHGGVEYRVESGSEIVHAALVTGGVGLNNTEFLVSGVLQRILGVTPFIKWSSNTSSSLVNKVSTEAAANPALASAFTACHSDAGLFGLYMIAHADDVRKVVFAAVNQFNMVAKGNISDAQLDRAKKQLKASILMTHENQSELLDDIATQVWLVNVMVS
jgi:ubiquinol-cytochrome c reductase core subunit 2